MRTHAEWVIELQQCGSDPQKLQQVVASIQSDAVHAGFENAMRTAMGVVGKSRQLTDDKLVQLRAVT